jgi:hypothetical protein
MLTITNTTVTREHVWAVFRRTPNVRLAYDEDELQAASEHCEEMFAREFEAYMGELGAVRFEEE